jgi:hypothetical protein
VYGNSRLFFIFDIQDSLWFLVVGLDYNGV